MGGGGGKLAPCEPNTSTRSAGKTVNGPVNGFPGEDKKQDPVEGKQKRENGGSREKKQNKKKTGCFRQPEKARSLPTGLVLLLIFPKQNQRAHGTRGRMTHETQDGASDSSRGGSGGSLSPLDILRDDGVIMRTLFAATDATAAVATLF